KPRSTTSNSGGVLSSSKMLSSWVSIWFDGMWRNPEQCETATCKGRGGKEEGGDATTPRVDGAVPARSRCKTWTNAGSQQLGRIRANACFLCSASPWSTLPSVERLGRGFRVTSEEVRGQLHLGASSCDVSGMPL